MALAFYLKKIGAVVLAGSLLVPAFALAAEPPQILSYQGRLADSGGTLLGSTSGTTYYFKFSLWSNATVGSGTRLWPASAPTAVSSTVRQGVFTVHIGDTASGYPDALNIHFADHDALYLQVEVSSDNSTYETLSPRQRVTSAAFAQLARSVAGTASSAVGTTTLSGALAVAATSSSAVGLSVFGASGQSADLFRILNNSLAKLFYVNSSGSVFASSTWQVTGAAHLYGGLTSSSTATSTFGGGINIDGGCFSVNGTCISAGGGSGTPGGADTQVQFNDGGSFGGDSGLTYNKTADRLTAGYASTTGISSSYASSTNLFAGSFTLGASAFTSLLGSGLTNSGGSLALDRTGDWTGTFDSQEGSYYLARANHTGTQLASTISDFASAFTTNFVTNLVATTSIDSITTLSGLSITKSQVSDFGTYENPLTFSYPLSRSTNTISLAFGTTTANTWSALQTFSYASTTGISSSYASSTNLFAGTLSVGSLSGFLKATAGAISTALINLASDVTGVLPVGNGGTGWAAVQSGAVLYGNGSSALATTTAGTNGYVLSLASGVPTWVATTTFGSGLTYAAGNVTLDRSGDWTGTFDSQEGSYYLARANHTGTQLASTISDFSDTVNAYLHGSTTLPKTYTANTYTALQTFSSAPVLGSLSGLVAGNGGATYAVSTSSLNANVTGNAGTATALETARTINGTSFDGTANITVTAASSTLLANNNTWSGTNVFSTTISGDISGNAGTVTNGVYTTTFNSLFDPRFVTQLAATTSVASITTLGNLSITKSQVSDFGTYENPLTFAYPFVRSTDTISLAFGTTTTNTWSALQQFTNASSSVASVYNGLFVGTTGTTTIYGTATSTFGAGIQTTALNITGSASSTFANGINLAAGCYAINGTCLSSGASVSAANTWTALQQFNANASTTQLSATRAYFGGTATSTFTAAGYLGIASSSPFYMLSVQGGDARIAATYTTVTVPTDLSGATYDSVSKSVNAQEAGPRGMAFSDDGTKMYISGNTVGFVYQYTLTSAWDLSTASYASKSLNVSGQDGNPYGIAFKSDGTKMYITGASNQRVYQYSLSSAWDISTASYDSVFKAIGSQDSSPQDVQFKSDGTKMYLVGNTNDRVYQYSLSPAWDLSTASYDSVNVSVSSQDGTPTGAYFSSDGLKMFVVGDTNNTVYQYTLSSAWNLSTASYASLSKSVNSQDGAPMALAFNSEGSKLYVLGDSNDTVYQYSLTTAGSTSVTGGNTIVDLKLAVGTSTYNGALTVWGSATDTSPLATFTNSASTSVLRIQNDGKIGIGTTTPNYKLSINASGAPQLSLGDGTSLAWTMRNANGTFYLATSTYTATSTYSALTIDTNGRVGIGTTTPGATFAVAGSGYISGDLSVSGDVSVAAGKCFRVDGVCIGYVKRLAAVYATSSTQTNATITFGTAAAPSGTWPTANLVVPASTTEMVVEVWGSGGGGGGRCTSTGCFSGGGGGAGGYAQKLVIGPSGTYYYTVGAGGSGGGAGTNGLAGGTGGSGGIVVTVYATSSPTAAGNDLAEMFPVSNPGIIAGDIVAVDAGTPVSMKHARAGDTAPLAGVVSTDPGYVLGDPSSSGMRPIALSGRVPTKVNLEGGTIRPGDRIAVSSVPGVGKKASLFDPSVGIALDTFDDDDADGTVMVFVTLQDGVDAQSIADLLLEYDWRATSTPAVAAAATSTATSSPESPESVPAPVFADTFLGKLFGKIAAWLGDAANGLASIFVGEVRTEKLCIGQTCVTEAELIELLRDSGQAPQAIAPDSEPSAEPPAEPPAPEPSAGSEAPAEEPAAQELVEDPPSAPADEEAPAPAEDPAPVAEPQEEPAPAAEDPTQEAPPAEEPEAPAEPES